MPGRTFCIPAATLLLAGPLLAGALLPRELRCDNQADPLAVNSAHPRLSWLLGAVHPPGRGIRQSGYRILVASSSKMLAQNRGDLWDTGRVASNITFEIPYAGKALDSAAECWWKVQVWDGGGEASAWSEPARWRMGLLDPSAWKAKWIAAEPDGTVPSLHMPVFRRVLRIDKRLSGAVVWISGLGQYELSVNGSKIGNAVLAPGWTNYRKTVLYNAYDLTAALHSGENAIGVMLGSGMYNVPRVPNRYTKLVGTFGQPVLIAQVRLWFADGSSEDVGTDSSWKTAPGPIVFSHAYGGEDEDARLDAPGWNGPGFDDAKWNAAVEVSGPGGRLTAQESPEIRVARTYPPERVTEPRPGIRVYDLGQNFSGWPAIRVRGPSGARVKLVPGELLTPDGLVTQRSSGGPQWFTYTLRGSGEESWHPRFSYYGFRYVQVETDPGVEVAALEGQFVHSSAEAAGEFSCSKDLFNRIHHLIGVAIRSNMQSVLTDCPHREKLGWLEESHLLGSAIMYGYGVQRLYRKIARDIADSQTADGLVPDIAPEYTVFQDGFRDSPEWGSAAVLDPWLVYRHYGDRDNLESHYDEMMRYVAYLGRRAQGGILSYGLGDWYDIGPRPPGVAQLTSLGVTATAIYHADVTTLRKVALLLGKAEDAARLDRLARSLRSAFEARFYDPATRSYDRGSQTAWAMPLALGMVPEDRRAEALRKLIQDIRAHRNHTTAGDIGFHFVLQALAEGGRSDVIYDMLANPTPPSYAAQLARGATSLTEAWDANPRSSQNHFMLGHAEEWFYRYLAGIDFDLSRPLSERIILRPTPVGDITFATARCRTPLGTIMSSWRRENGKFLYDVEVPPNASAEVYLPERGGTASPHRIDSGNYHFEIPQ